MYKRTIKLVVLGLLVGTFCGVWQTQTCAVAQERPFAPQPIRPAPRPEDPWLRAVEDLLRNLAQPPPRTQEQPRPAGRRETPVRPTVPSPQQLAALSDKALRDVLDRAANQFSDDLDRIQTGASWKKYLRVEMLKRYFEREKMQQLEAESQERIARSDGQRRAQLLEEMAKRFEQQDADRREQLLKEMSTRIAAGRPGKADAERREQAAEAMAKQSERLDEVRRDQVLEAMRKQMERQDAQRREQVQEEKRKLSERPSPGRLADRDTTRPVAESPERTGRPESDRREQALEAMRKQLEARDAERRQELREEARRPPERPVAASRERLAEQLERRDAERRSQTLEAMREQLEVRDAERREQTRRPVERPGSERREPTRPERQEARPVVQPPERVGRPDAERREQLEKEAREQRERPGDHEQARKERREQSERPSVGRRDPTRPEREEALRDAQSQERIGRLDAERREQLRTEARDRADPEDRSPLKQATSRRRERPVNGSREQLVEIAARFDEVAGNPDYHRIAELYSFQTLRLGLHEYTLPARERQVHVLSASVPTLIRALRGPSLGPTWISYLHLETLAELVGDDSDLKPADADLLTVILGRFESVRENPDYRVITEMPGFETTRDALSEYILAVEKDIALVESAPRIPESSRAGPASDQN